MIWRPSIATGLVLPADAYMQEEEPGLREFCERLSLHYYQRLRLAVTDNHVPSEHQPLFDYITHLLPLVRRGEHPTAKADWLNDSWEDLEGLTKQYIASVDVQLIQAVGENIIQVVKGSTTMLEHMLADQLLMRFYTQGIGFDYANTCLGHGIAQLAHQHPKMRILEVGAGTGGTTKSVLKAIDDAYTSYHFTDISMGFVSSAEVKFGTSTRAMTFGVLDIEQDITTQGFAEGAYDLIIASNVLHATKSLRHTLRRVRSLLRSGGYLVLLETTGHVLRCGFQMCGLPGWWLGQDDGRLFSPTQSCQQWNELLKVSGFSGADSVTHDSSDQRMHGFSVIFAQATDAIIDNIRAPLTSIYSPSKAMLLIGNADDNSKGFLSDTKSSLESLGGSVTTLNSLHGITTEYLEGNPHVLYLGELDAPIFERISSQSLAAIQVLLQHAKSILWVTTGRDLENPYSNMLVGLLRCIQNESTNVQMQVVDFASREDITSHVLGEAFLRFINTAAAANSDRLSTLEPELAVIGGKIMIPRVLPIPDMNAQWNSFRRVIRHNATRGSCSSLGNSLPLAKKYEALGILKTRICIETSTNSAVRVSPTCFMFLVLGHVTANRQKVMALSPTKAGELELPSNCIYPLAYDCIKDESLLCQSLCYLLTESILERFMGKTILLHNCDWRLVKSIQAATSHLRQSVDVITSSFATNHQLETSHITIHPRATKAQISALLPSGLDIFVDFTARNAAETASSENLIRSLPDQCTLIGTSDLVSFESKIPARWDAHHIPKLLQSIAEQGRDFNAYRWAQEDVETGSVFMCTSSVVPHEAPIQRLDPAKLFRSECTYLLCGLTGEIGHSICSWMVHNGARHVALTSRSPSLDRSWCVPLERLGARIVILSLDICDQRALFAVLEKLRATMPPVAGVAHGAMVLSDATFANMTIEDLQRVLRPKVVGSINLDKAFEYDKLDFFIMFSSLACVIGNVGQSNYAAANMVSYSL
jgi:hybrid polyketide synthase/nonribosomal peptide synthetase ACE1